MPDSQTGSSDSKSAKRSLPSWTQNESSKRPAGSSVHEDSVPEEKHTGNGRNESTGPSSSSSAKFSKLLVETFHIFDFFFCKGVAFPEGR